MAKKQNKVIYKGKSVHKLTTKRHRAYFFKTTSFIRLDFPMSRPDHLGYITFGASLKWLNFMYFSHLIPKMSLILAVSSHFTITPVLAKKQICSKWDTKSAFAPNLEP